MAQISTTIEQSKKLIELGIDIDTADMWYVPKGNYYKLVTEPSLTMGIIPAWSLSAIMGLMPSATLDSSNDHYYRLRCMEKFTEWYDNPIDAVFEMICYLLENKLI